MPAERPARHSRSEPREIAELKQIKTAHPELATAVDMQIALVELQRRVQARVALPWIEVDAAWLKQQQQAGHRLLRFEDIPLDWTEFRLMFRQTADILRRFDVLDPADYTRVQAIAREGDALQPLVVRWYASSAPRSAPAAASAEGASTEILGDDTPEMLEQILALAIRPFLARCAEAVLPRTDLSAWEHGDCPLCGAEPELAVITPAAERLLVCGRCTARWRFDSLTCPFCRNADRSRITSFATPDGRYRVYACDACRRYLKAYDNRRSERPLMLSVDAIATLPLDAAAIQRGYTA